MRSFLACVALCVLGDSAHAPTAYGLESDACVRPAVTLRYYGRAEEETALPLTRCDGRAYEPSRDPLSVLTRPRGTEVPVERREGEFIADDIRRLDGQLLVLLQRLADEWPGHTIEIVSGYRPRARQGSRHRGGHALDVRVVGVHRTRVAALGRTWARTGVGFYPNSTFTHLDVRDSPTFWVDESSPGERPRYVPGEEEDAVFAAALARAGEDESDGEVAAASAPSTTGRRSPLDLGEVRAAARAAMEVLLDHEQPRDPQAPLPAHEPSATRSAVVRRVVVAEPPPPIDWAPPW